MLFTQSFSRVFATIALCALIVFQLPARAEIGYQSIQIRPVQNKDSKPGLAICKLQQAVMLDCAMCGCNELCAVTCVGASVSSKRDASLLTDSLWGNLILEMAYQRDPLLRKFAKKLNLASNVTMATIFGIAGGTLAQAVTGLYVLNPPAGKLDSYAPPIIGTSLSSLTMLTFLARNYFDHKFQKQIKTRQLAIRDRILDIIHHLEFSEAKCPEVKKELAELIGERATGEYLQLWQSSHTQLASTEPRKISLLYKTDVKSNIAAPPACVP